MIAAGLTLMSSSNACFNTVGWELIAGHSQYNGMLLYAYVHPIYQICASSKQQQILTEIQCSPINLCANCPWRALTFVTLAWSWCDHTRLCFEPSLQHSLSPNFRSDRLSGGTQRTADRDHPSSPLHPPLIATAFLCFATAMAFHLVLYWLPFQVHGSTGSMLGLVCLLSTVAAWDGEFHLLFLFECDSMCNYQNRSVPEIY